MTRPLSIGAVMLALGLVLGQAGAADWAKQYVPQGDYSLHYPAGWAAGVEQGVVAFADQATGEQALVMPVAMEPQRTLRDFAAALAQELGQETYPGLKVITWNDTDDPHQVVALHFSFGAEGETHVGDALVAREGDTVLWTSYAARRADYYDERSGLLLEAMLGSLAGGQDSQPPARALPSLGRHKAERNGRAFLFVLEFALGAPLNTSAEQLVLGELYQAWEGRPAEELAPFDQYSALRDDILALGEGQVQKLQEELRQTTLEVLRAAPDDPAMKAIRAQLEQGSREVAPGDPPLRQVEALALAEMLAYGELLRVQPEARPEDLQGAVVSGLRQQIVSHWPQLSAAERQTVKSLPSLWMVARTVLTTGTAAEQQRTRQQLQELAASVAPPAGEAPPTVGNASLGREQVRRYVQHNTLLMMQQQTFNTYMWSRGYQGWRPTGKLW